MRAQRRADNINRYLWDEATGYYLDYNFKKKNESIILLLPPFILYGQE